MVEVLERIAEKSGSKIVSENGKYNEGGNNTGYFTFSEMYLEKPVHMGLTPTASSWGGVPTIDDW